MENKDKHIDQFFRDKMDAHLEPLSADDRVLFENSIAGRKTAGASVLKRIVKWLPYMSALSAAAAISYYGVVYRAEKKPEVVQASPIINTRAQQAPTAPLPIVPDTQLTATGYKQLAVQQPATIAPKLYSLPAVAPVMNSAQYRYELLKSMMPLNKQMLASVEKQYPASAVQRKYNLPPLPEPADNNVIIGRRAQLSVHLGFESGLSKATYNAGVLGVQVKTKIANNLHIGAGAILRYAQTPDIYLPQQQVLFDNYQRYVIITQGKRAGQYTYNYREKVDSTVIRYDVDKQFFDVELPVFVQYDLSKRFSVSAGIKFIYGSVAKINASSSRYTPMYTDTIRDINYFVDEEAAVGLFDKRCNCVSDNTADYQNPEYNTIRTGYMLGVQYRPMNKVELGLSMQQNSTSLSNIPNPDVRKMYALPYFRLSVGYTFGSKK